MAAWPWRDLRLRLVTALVLGPLVLACIWLGGHWFTALIAVAVAGLAWEWVRMCGARPGRGGIAVPVAVLAAGALAALGQPALGVALLLPGATLVFWRARSVHARFLAAGVLYIGLAGIALLTLRHEAGAGRANVVFLILVVWASDSAAYLVGRALGGRRLWPAVSPGKTWSGAAGGLAGAMLVGLLATAVAPAPWLGAALLGGALGLLAQAGDLLESGIKRHYGVKDSSQADSRTWRFARPAGWATGLRPRRGRLGWIWVRGNICGVRASFRRAKAGLVMKHPARARR